MGAADTSPIATHSSLYGTTEVPAAAASVPDDSVGRSAGTSPAANAPTRVTDNSIDTSSSIGGASSCPAPAATAANVQSLARESAGEACATAPSQPALAPVRIRRRPSPIPAEEGAFC